MDINEATFEARLNEEVGRLFPTLRSSRLSHQKVLNVKLGRREISLDAEIRSQITGRYDVLLQLDEKPIALFELKRPGATLNTEDRDQGISYARLITPMPPLVIISNGSEVQFYNTYDAERWEPKNLNEQIIQNLFRVGFEFASHDKDQAVKSLLGQEQGIWTGVIREYTSKQIEIITGEINDASYPLTNDFRIKRVATDKLLEAITDKNMPLIALTGPPLSGKTSLLSQLIEKLNYTQIVPLYFNSKSISYDPIQHLSNILSRELFFSIKPQDVRIWLISALNNLSEYKLLFIIDEVFPINLKQLEGKIYELLYLSEDKQISILLSLDENIFHKWSYYPGRQSKTEIGRKAHVVKIKALNDEEFMSACKELNARFKLSFNPGAYYNFGLRNPRILRVLVAEVLNSIDTSFLEGNRNGFEKVGRLSSISNFSTLNIVWQRFMADPNLRFDFKQLAKAHIEDKDSRYKDPSINILSHGRGHITCDTVESVLGNDRFERLKNQGFLSVIEGPNGKILALPKLPEMLSAAAVFVISDEAIKIFEKGSENKAYKYVLENSFSLPLGDVVGGMSIIEMFRNNQNILSFFIESLLSDPPRIKAIDENKRVLASIPDIGEIEIHIPPSAGESLVENIHPWLILSHLASIPMTTDKETPNVFFKILATVGSYPDVLIRPEDNAINKIKGFHVHNFSGKGACICSKMGIVEPITHAMFKGFHNFPDFMVSLAKWAAENDNIPLASRIQIAAEDTETAVEEKVAESAKTSNEIVWKLLKSSIDSDLPC